MPNPSCANIKPSLGCGSCIKKKATPNKLCTDKGGWDVLLTKTAHFNIKI